MQAGDDPPTRFSRQIGAAVERFAKSGSTLEQVRDSLLRYAALCHLMGEQKDDFAERAKWALAKEEKIMKHNAKAGGEA
jgi:hypothetical protein